MCRRISASLPSVQWRREPSFIERHRHLPEDHPIRKDIDGLTPEQRAWSSRPQFQGLYEGEGFTLEFFGSVGPIVFVNVDVRGSGNPMPTLAGLCRANAWALKEVAAGKVLDLSGPAAEWEAFTRWRDRALGEITGKDKAVRGD